MGEGIKNEEIIEKRKEKIINWLKKPSNLILVLVLIFAFALRLYYFILVKNQPLWWDEACYGILAKNFIIDSTYEACKLGKGNFSISSTIFVKFSLTEIESDKPAIYSDLLIGQ